MMDTVRLVSNLKVDGIKFHHLYISKDTPLEKAYDRGKIELLTLEEYLSILCDALEILPPQIVIHRLTGDLYGDYLIAPHWKIGPGEIHNLVQKELDRRGTWQGSALEG